MPRADLNTLSAANRTNLVNLILAYLNDAVVAAHTTIIHNDIHIFTGHRTYIEGLEAFLAANGGGQFVPLPKWDPAKPIPAEFNVVKPRDDGTQRAPMGNLNPNRPKPSQFAIPAVWIFPNGDDLGNAVNPWHSDVHGAVGGTFGNFNQASAAPIFWCWHAYVDEIYSDWEQRNLADGRPIWIGNFSRSDRAEVLYHYPRDTDWWLGSNPSGQFQWRSAGNTTGFGQGHITRQPNWIGDFNGNGRADVLFYFPGDGNWWLGSHDGNELAWSFAGNTNGFGQVWDGRPFWTGNFSRADRAEMLFYFPGDDNWWLGSHDGNELAWSFAGNTAGFGQGHITRQPNWIGDFNGNGRADVLFYNPGDDNWWLGSHDGNELAWSFAGNTTGFGQGHITRQPVWTGNFSRADQAEVLFYYPGDGNWWLGSHDGNELAWSFAGNTLGFGQVWDGRPFWTGDFNGNGRAEVLFYYPGDGNWWLGSHPGLGGQLQWTFAGNRCNPRV